MGRVDKFISAAAVVLLICAVTLFFATFLSGCGKAKDGKAGPQGTVGTAGSPGAPGTDGIGCTVVQVAPGVIAPNGGALVTCGGASVLLVNGATGPQGEQGPVTTYGVTSVIDPCGDAPGITDEVLLKLANGQVLASFSDNINGYNTRLSLLQAGSYQTSDGSNCNFSVDSAGNVSF